jgi:hypothetical protein
VCGRWLRFPGLSGSVPPGANARVGVAATGADAGKVDPRHDPGTLPGVASARCVVSWGHSQARYSTMSYIRSSGRRAVVVDRGVATTLPIVTPVR